MVMVTDLEYLCLSFALNFLGQHYFQSMGWIFFMYSMMLDIGLNNLEIKCMCTMVVAVVKICVCFFDVLRPRQHKLDLAEQVTLFQDRSLFEDYQL